MHFKPPPPIPVSLAPLHLLPSGFSKRPGPLLSRSFQPEATRDPLNRPISRPKLRLFFISLRRKRTGTRVITLCRKYISIDDDREFIIRDNFQWTRKRTFRFPSKVLINFYLYYNNKYNFRFIYNFIIIFYSDFQCFLRSIWDVHFIHNF